MAFQEKENGEVQITLTKDEFNWLVFAMGLAAGGANKDANLFTRMVKLTNAINDGNPNWAPLK